MKKLSILMVVPFLALMACENKQEEAPPPEPAPVEQPAPAPAPTPAPEVAVVEVPTAADFEQQALDEINAQNAEDELVKIEKEISE